MNDAACDWLEPKPTDAEIAARINQLAEYGDEELEHIEADAILCEVLKGLGWTQTVKAFEGVGKYYS